MSFEQRPQGFKLLNYSFPEVLSREYVEVWHHQIFYEPILLLTFHWSFNNGSLVSALKRTGKF